MKLIKPGQYFWVFTIQVVDDELETLLKLVEAEKIGWDPSLREWVLFDKEDQTYYADECIETDYQPQEEKLDIIKE